MQSYSEVECAFLAEKFSVDEFISACKLLKERGFDLNLRSPGYVYGEDFEYPEWASFEQAFEQIRNGDFEAFGLNFCLVSKINISFTKLSLGADADTRSISLKAGEEFFVDPELGRIKRSELIKFSTLSQDLSSLLSVKAWKIAQTGFDYDICRATFISYVTGSRYPLYDIDNTISWYENEYLNRWQ